MEEWIRGLDVGDEVTIRVGEYEYGGAADWMTDFDTGGVDELDVEVTGVIGEREITTSKGVKDGGYAIRVEFGEDVAREMNAERVGGKLVCDGLREEYDLTLSVAAEITAGMAQTLADIEVTPAEIAADEGVPAGAEKYRQPALDAVEKVRSKSVERVVLVDAYVCYAREEGESDVWGEYVEEVEEPSLSGFLSWLEEDDVGRLLDEAIGMFPGREDVLDASGRTGWDAVFALQHFRDADRD